MQKGRGAEQVPIAHFELMNRAPSKLDVAVQVVCIRASDEREPGDGGPPKIVKGQCVDPGLPACLLPRRPEAVRGPWRPSVTRSLRSVNFLSLQRLGSDWAELGGAWARETKLCPAPSEPCSRRDEGESGSRTHARRSGTRKRSSRSAASATPPAAPLATSPSAPSCWSYSR